MRAAVVGAGMSGLAAAYALAGAGVEVVVYEKEENQLCGHAKTLTFDGVDVHFPSILFNHMKYPNVVEFFESLGVDMEPSDSDMSFSVTLDNEHDMGGCDWCSNELSALFAPNTNVVNPYFSQIIKLDGDVQSYLDSNPDITDRSETLGQFAKSRGYSELFQKAYLIPLCATIWSCTSKDIIDSSAVTVLTSLKNHQSLQMFGRPQWLTVSNRSQTYVKKVKAALEDRGCQIKTGIKVQSIFTIDNKGCTVVCNDGSEDNYDGCIIAVNAPEALNILGNQATFDEKRILGAFQYEECETYLHHDTNFMPKNRAAWSAWNFRGGSSECVTFWLNLGQNLGDTKLPFLETLNPPRIPDHTLLKWTTSHPVPSVAASKASLELHHIQGKSNVWFCGSYQGCGFHEDSFKAGTVAAHEMIGKQCAFLENPKQMVPSLLETGARIFVTGFLKNYISTGTLILLEEGGTVFTFKGSQNKCPLKVTLKIHNPQFYWKIMTQADLGLADAYINGDFSLVDKDEGLLNLFQIFAANSSKSTSKRGWWALLTVASGVASAKHLVKHVFLRKNTLTRARRNIAEHYDLSNELFALFLDETMTYSCAIFKAADEDLKVAQERKLSLLIKKARVEKHHHVLDIGCGWGGLAIEAVKQTGCKYTGITLSEEQLKLAQLRVREAGLEEQIKFILCDYRQLPSTHKFDRIISCGMLEHVGHEYIEEFFRCCETALADDGLLVLQFITVADSMYDEYRHSPGFIKEYIFPGGVLPCLSKVTSAMASASNLCVEHLENIGIHYYQTLRCWRKNFMERQREVMELGLDEKFIRVWEYYLDYCAAGFKSRILGDYQIVFSRPGNNTAFSNIYESFPAA